MPTAFSPDANLLFGVLAFQNGFISRDQLIAGMQAWVENKQLPLDEHLLKAGALSADVRGLLQPLVAAHIRQHGDDPQRSLAALSSADDIRQGLAGIADSELQHSLLHVGHAASGPGPQSAGSNVPPAPACDATMTLGSSPADGARFRILRPHARGGIGEVFVARDTELGREVALKEIQLDKSHDPEARARFTREAEITGGLEHPGIVPVYGLGTYPDGRPFYAMRFIRGNSLQDAIRAFHVESPEGHPPAATAVAQASPHDNRKSATEKNLELRRLLQRFIDVCEAIDYAHSRGVLHRDLKPGNIMLGRYGETLVVDWGLAKAGGEKIAHHHSNQSAAAPSSDALPEPLVATGSGDSSDPTQMGFVPGTPAYMSPEHALGRIDLIGPASDVFSLGATLYHLLTGRPPYAGTDALEVHRLAQRGEFPRPRAVGRPIHPALEAICEKALRILPTERYASAKALADDVEHYLADEPVTALPESALARLSRWSRRHRQWVGAGTLALALIALVAGLAYLREARLVTEKSKLLSDKEQLIREKELLAEQAKARQKEAEQLALDKTTLAAEKTALATAEKEEADKARKLSTFLIETFQASDPVGQGGAPFFITRANSEKLTALEILERGASRVKTDAELAQHPLARAAVMDAIGDVYRQLGMFREAEPLLSEALAVRREKLPSDHADVATSCHNLAWYYHERGDFLKAETLYQEALAIRRKLDGKEGQRLAANTMHNLAWMRAWEGKLAEAGQLFRDTMKLRAEVLGKKHREVTFSKLGVAFCLIEQQRNVEALPLVMAVKDELLQLEGNQALSDGATQFAQGIIYRRTLGPSAAEPYLLQALESVKKGFGTDNGYVGGIHYEVGYTQAALGKLVEAEEHYKEAMRISREQVRLQHPRVRILIEGYSDFLRKQRRAAEGKAIWEEFMQAQIDRFGPDHWFVAQARIDQGSFLRDSDDPEALPVLQEVVENCRRHPEWPVQGRAYSMYQLGLIFGESEDSANAIQAEQLFREFISLTETRTDEHNEIPFGLVMAKTHVARAMARQEKLSEAEMLCLTATEAARKLSGGDQAKGLDFSLEVLARIRRLTKNFSGAAEATLDRKRLWKKNPKELYSLAEEFGECASGCVDATAPTAEQLTAQAAFRDQAMQTLREAFSAGYRNKKAAASSEQFATLRELPEFQQLVSESPMSDEPAGNH